MATAPITRNRVTHSEINREAYKARDVGLILDLPLPSVYEIARRDPERLGVIRFGRSLRFRRAVIEKLIAGEEARPTT